MNRIEGEESPTISRKKALRALLSAVAAEAEADERYQALARMRPGDSSPTVAKLLESRHARLIEARFAAEARATEVLQVLGAGGLLGVWLSSIGDDE